MDHDARRSTAVRHHLKLRDPDDPPEVVGASPLDPGRLGEEPRLVGVPDLMRRHAEQPSEFGDSDVAQVAPPVPKIDMRSIPQFYISEKRTWTAFLPQTD